MTYRAVIDPPGFVIRNSTISVDYWPRTDKIPITHHFLTHAHSDHIKGLDSTWTHGLIYCTKVTQKLLCDLVKVQRKYIEVLEVDRPHQFKLNDEQSFQVEIIDANHCPGAVMYLFNGYFGTILATGDFRYDPNMFVDTPLTPFVTQETSQVIDICYLDNTYCSKEYESIPTREEALKEAINYISLNIGFDKKIVIKLKKLGKESLIVNLAKHFKCKILLSKERYARYTKVLDLDADLFTNEFHSSLFIEVEDTDKLYTSVFASRYNVDEVVYIEPTALFLNKASYISTRQRAPNFSSIFHVAYTDHSSYPELLEFISILRPKSVLAIVKEMEANKCNAHVINDMNCFNKYLNKEPIIEAHNQYRLLLQTTSLVRHSKRHVAAAATTIIVNNTKNKKLASSRILRKKRDLPRRIEYEETTPVKEVKNAKTQNEKWKIINDNVEMLSEEEEEEEEENDEVELNKDNNQVPEIEYMKDEIEYFPDIAETQAFSVISTQKIINSQQQNKNKNKNKRGASSGGEESKSIVINHTLDDYIQQPQQITTTTIDDDKDSFLSARSNSIDFTQIQMMMNDNDDHNDEESINFIKKCLNNVNSNEDDKEFDDFVNKLMCI